MEPDRWYRLRTDQQEYVFAANGGPIDNPDSAPELLIAVGHAVMAFGRFEHLLDAILAHVNQRQDAPHLYSDHPRNAFDRKIKLLKLWMDQHPPLAATAQKYAETLPAFAEMWKLRSGLIHAYFQSFDPVTRVADVRRANVEGKGVINWEERDEPLEDIERLIRITSDGYTILRGIAEEVFPDAH